MNKFSRYFLLLIYIFLTGLCYAETSGNITAPHSELKYNLIKNPASSLLLEIKLEKNWYIYNNENNPIGRPTTIEVINNKKVKITSIDWPSYELMINKDGSQSKIYQDNAKILLHYQNITNTDNIELAVNYLICNDRCIPVNKEITINLANSNYIEKYPEKSQLYAKFTTLAYMVLLALLGGFILNFMPCVLPVISIKLFSIINVVNSDNKQQVRLSLLANAAGIITCFLCLAIFTISLTFIGQYAGWGVYFRNPIFIITLAIILFLSACNLWGSFTIRVPLFFSNLGNLNYNGQNLAISNFLTGVIATILATPCTAPFIATATSYAITKGPFEILLIYLSLGLGMSLPYLIPIIFPEIINHFPRPGIWMEKLKKFLGLTLFCTVFWLISIIAGQLGLSSAVILFLILVLLKFILENSDTFGKLQKNNLVICLGLIILALILPLKTSNLVRKNDSYINHTWQTFKPDEIDRLVEDGKVVIVDVTADWCIICKINKITILDRVDIVNYLNRPNVVAMRADLTNDDPVIIGFLAKYKRSGIPFNIIFGPNAKNGIVLPTFFSKNELIDLVRKAE